MQWLINTLNWLGETPLSLAIAESEWLFPAIEVVHVFAVSLTFGIIAIIGYLLCYGWSHITIYNPLTGANVPLQIYYSPTHYIVAGGISLICCTGAAFFPARKATRVHPVEIIRGAS